MAAVHVGVPREAAAVAEAGEEAAGGASSGLGWAWAAQGAAEAMEAQRTSDFVFHLLQGQVLAPCSMLLAGRGRHSVSKALPALRVTTDTLSTASVSKALPALRVTTDTLSTARGLQQQPAGSKQHSIRLDIDTCSLTCSAPVHLTVHRSAQNILHHARRADQSLKGMVACRTRIREPGWLLSFHRRLSSSCARVLISQGPLLPIPLWCSRMSTFPRHRPLWRC